MINGTQLGTRCHNTQVTCDLEDCTGAEIPKDFYLNRPIFVGSIFYVRAFSLYDLPCEQHVHSNTVSTVIQSYNLGKRLKRENAVVWDAAPAVSVRPAGVVGA